MLLADDEEEEDEEEVGVSGSAWLGDSTLQWDWAACPALVWEGVSNKKQSGEKGSRAGTELPQGAVFQCYPCTVQSFSLASQFYIP